MTWGYKIDGQSKPEVYSSELGKKYNAITIVDYVGFCIKHISMGGNTRVTKMHIFKCICDCGEKTYEWIEDIKSGKVQKCKKCGKNCMKAVDNKAKTKVKNMATGSKVDNKAKTMNIGEVVLCYIYTLEIKKNIIYLVTKYLTINLINRS